MKSEQLTAQRYIFPDMNIIEIFNSEEKTWEYYVALKDDADLHFFIGVHEEDRLAIEFLWKDGFFDTAKEEK